MNFIFLKICDQKLSDLLATCKFVFYIKEHNIHMSDHDQLEPWQRKMMYRDDGHHSVTKNYNTGFYQECQQEEDDDDEQETPCDACGNNIKENCIYWRTVNQDTLYNTYRFVEAEIPEKISNNWICGHQGCGLFCADCILQCRKNTDDVMQMHISSIFECPVYWRKFTIKRCKKSSNIYLVSLQS